MITVGASQPFEAVYESGVPGQVGTVAVVVIDNDGVEVLGPTTAGVTENDVGGTPTGVYTWNAAAAPAPLGQYTIMWSLDGTFDPNSVSVEDLVVVSATNPGVLPPLPQPAGGGPSLGPATAWTTSDQVAVCCAIEDGTDPEVFDPWVDVASQTLYLESGRLFYGLSSKEGVRPPCRPGCGCGIQVLSRGHVVVPRDWDWWGESAGPCDPSRVLLSGYPVREVTQVKIDGAVVASTEYRLERYRWLVRKNGEAWPSCQDLSIDDTEEGTWSVSYTFGQEPPLLGVEAANELACQLYQSCNGGDENCAIPAGAVRLTRAGVTIERGIFKRDPKTGAWATGMLKVDMFLNSVNPQGLIRRPVVTSPASHLRHARKVA